MALMVFMAFIGFITFAGGRSSSSDLRKQKSWTATTFLGNKITITIIFFRIYICTSYLNLHSCNHFSFMEFISLISKNTQVLVSRRRTWQFLDRWQGWHTTDTGCQSTSTFRMLLASPNCCGWDVFLSIGSNKLEDHKCLTHNYFLTWWIGKSVQPPIDFGDGSETWTCSGKHLAWICQHEKFMIFKNWTNVALPHLMLRVWSWQRWRP